MGGSGGQNNFPGSFFCSGKLGQCVPPTCDDLNCEEECNKDGKFGPECQCFNKNLVYPDCDRERSCKFDENTCGSFANCTITKTNKVHCECKNGGVHPHCKTNGGCDPFSCKNLLSRCEEKNGKPTCKCRFYYVTSDCTSFPQFPITDGPDECENDIECQETFNVDFYCFKGKCLLKGCRVEADCPGGSGCSYNGHCDPCTRSTCKGTETCRIVEDKYKCDTKCPNECKRGQDCIKKGNEYICMCKNGLHTPDCRDPCEACDTEHAVTCKVNEDQKPECTCKSPQEKYPDCTCSVDCGPNSICDNDFGHDTCSCKPGFVGKPPNCQKPTECKKPCKSGEVCVLNGKTGKEVCVCINQDCSPTCDNNCGNGKCLLNSLGDERCSCDDGYPSPSCIEPNPPNCSDNCGLGHCKVTSDGKAECVCDNPEYRPPSCGPECSKTCPSGQMCVKYGREETCICKYSGKPPDCIKDPCDEKNCDPQTQRCIVIDGIAHCQCIEGGFLDSYCPDPNPCFNRNCLPDSYCISQNGGPKCVCYNGGTYPNCKNKCTKDCGSLGECVLVNDIQKCICKNGIGDYPNCDPCKPSCTANSECVVHTSGNFEVRCKCKDGYAGVSPYCFPSCDDFPCQSNQMCAIIHGKAECICREPGRAMPNCLKDPCENIDCGKKATCSAQNGRYKCICTDIEKPYPCCSDAKSCNACDGHYCKEPGKCVLTSTSQPKCICDGKGFTYPFCSEDPCEPIKCSSDGKCFQTSVGKAICLCKDKSLKYPGCEKPCLTDCPTGSHCDKGSCICNNPNRQYPNCLTCNNIDCGKSNCKIIKGNPTCLCPDDSEPPCSGCEKPCSKQDECINRKCVPKCNCKSNSYCVREEETLKPKCHCKGSGSYPDCDDCNCNSRNETCIILPTGTKECRCSDINHRPKCVACNPEDCQKIANAECGFVNGVEQCVCKNPSLQYPNCEKSCPKNQESVISDGSPICVCSINNGQHLKLPNSDGNCEICTFSSDCGKNAKCINSECKCNNPNLVHPNCGEDCKGSYCPCKDIECPLGKMCVISESGPVCICEHITSDGECGDKCSPDKVTECERRGGTCKIINGHEMCDCGERFFKECPIDCDPPCKGNLKCVSREGKTPACVCIGDCPCSDCSGLCINNKCICTNGGVPPKCIPTKPDPCKEKYCGREQCELVSGVPVCTCPDPNLQYPNCVKNCKCKPNEVCNSAGECVCAPGHEGPDCNFCARECGKKAHCVKDVNTSEEHCVCNGKGKYPDCEEKVCSPKCKSNEYCALVDNKPKCICSDNQHEKCPTICNKKCKPNGQCAISQGKEICICQNGDKNWPNCENCKSRLCKSSNCIMENGKEKCPCPSDKNLDEDDPNCDPCSALQCDIKGRC